MAWVSTEDHMVHAGKGGVPWHGDSLEMNEDQLDFESMFKAAHLDFRVEPRELYVSGVGPLTADFSTQLNRVAQVRVGVDGEPDKVIGITSREYSTVQPIDAFAPFDACAKDFNLKYETAGYLNNGSKIWMLVRREDADVKIAGIDAVASYIMLVNSYDRSTGVGAISTPVRVQCRNTFALPVQNRTNKARTVVTHSGDMGQKIKEAASQLTIVSQAQKEMYTRLEQMAQINATEQQLEEVMGILDPKPEENATERMMEMWDRRQEAMYDMYLNSPIANDQLRDSVYGVFNFATEWLDHGARGRKDAKSNLFNLVSGEKSIKRTRIFNILDPMAVSV